jgi:hypothetical protein
VDLLRGIRLLVFLSEMKILEAWANNWANNYLEAEMIEKVWPKIRGAYGTTC